jgi:hypothetical protein
MKPTMSPTTRTRPRSPASFVIGRERGVPRPTHCTG